VTVIMGTLSVRYTDRLIMRFGARALVLAGLALFMAGLALFTRAPVEGDYVMHVEPVMVLLGTGAGLCFPALMTLAMSGATPSDAGLASGLISTTAQVGGALGLAVFATLAASRSESLIQAGAPTPAALTSGYHLAFWIGTALAGRRSSWRRPCWRRGSGPRRTRRPRPRRSAPPPTARLTAGSGRRRRRSSDGTRRDTPGMLFSCHPRVRSRA
jgi:MFS family permease